MSENCPLAVISVLMIFTKALGLLDMTDYHELHEAFKPTPGRFI